MKPINFPQSNKTLSKPDSMTDEECSPLHVYGDGLECVSLWKPSFKERLSILFYGCIWLGVLGGYTQPPVWLDGRKNIFIKSKKEQ